MLRDSKILKTTSHLIWNLKSRSLGSQSMACESGPHYPDDLIFTAEPFVQLSTIKGKVFRSDSGEAISNSYILLTSKKDETTHLIPEPMKRANICLEALWPEITRCPSMVWFSKRSEVPCQNPLETKDEGRRRYHGRMAAEESRIHGNRHTRTLFHRIRPGEYQRLRFSGAGKRWGVLSKRPNRPSRIPAKSTSPTHRDLRTSRTTCHVRARITSKECY